MAATGVSSRSFISARYSNPKDTHLSSTRFKKSILGFKYNIDLKCGNLLVQESGSRNRLAAPAPARKKVEVVKCTAEGLERGIFGGQKGKFVMPERLKVVGLMACVMCLCNADRVVMSVAIVPLAAKHGWSSSFLGIVQSSFLWGYIFSSVIGGALVDKYGGKRVIAWGVALWSLATLLTPWAANHSTTSLLAVRAFFGLAEGVALPSMNILLSRWFPCNERATAVGLSMGGFHLGNVVGLVLTPLVMSSVGLFGPFILFASLGLLWLSTWTLRVTNDPQESPSISQSELRLIQAGKSNAPPLKKGELPPLRLLLSKMPTWAIIFANITNNWGYFVLLSWMPVYFKTKREFNIPEHLMIHDWAFTDSHYILFGNRIKLDILGSMTAVCGFTPMISALSVNPSKSTSPIYLLPRFPEHQGERDWKVPIEAPSQMWVLHVGNAYEETDCNGNTHIQIQASSCSYKWFNFHKIFGYDWQSGKLDPSIMNADEEGNKLLPQLVQVSITLDASGDYKKCFVNPLNDQWEKATDFPVINQDFGGSNNTYVYAATSLGARRELPNFPFDTVVKFNTEKNSTQTWSVGTRRFIGEPIFISKGNNEDDGYLVVVEYAVAEQRCYLVILDAKKIGETNAVVARLEVPKHLNFPLGFHGFWAPKNSKT